MINDYLVFLVVMMITMVMMMLMLVLLLLLFALVRNQYLQIDKYVIIQLIFACMLYRLI